MGAFDGAERPPGFECWRPSRPIPILARQGSIRVSPRPTRTPSMSLTPSDVTQLLQRWSDGDRDALDQLVPLVYEHLRRVAHQRVRHEDASPSLNTTGLVHEAYLKLVDLRRARFRDRAHFLAMASRVMRRLLIDHARARRAARRGGGIAAMELGEALAISDPQADALSELDEALQRLEQIDPRQSDQNVRGSVALPHGIGKNVRVAVFAQGENAEKATAAGADIVAPSAMIFR